MKQIPQILTKEMLKEYSEHGEGKHQKQTNELKDLVLVHKTKYPPIDNCIKAPRDIEEAMQPYYHPICILGKTYNRNLKHERNTVHFSVNGEVLDHQFGNFSKRKYIIMIPGDKIEKKKFIGGELDDVYTNGTYEIPKGAIIICPANEIVEIKNKNKGQEVFGYEGEYADGYGNLLLNKMGYAMDKSYKVFELLFSEKGLNLKPTRHSVSEQVQEEYCYQEMHAYTERIKIIKEEELLTKDTAIELIKDTRWVTKKFLIELKDEKFLQNALPTLLEKWKNELEGITGMQIPVEIMESIRNVKNLDEKDIEELAKAIQPYCHKSEIEKILPDFVENMSFECEQSYLEGSIFNEENRQKIFQKLYQKYATAGEILFYDDEIAEKSYELLRSHGMSISEELKAQLESVRKSSNLEETIARENLSDDIKAFIQENQGRNRNELIMGILLKESEKQRLNTEIKTTLYGKTLEDLNEDEKKYIAMEIEKIEGRNQQQYKIILSTRLKDEFGLETDDIAIGENTIGIYAKMDENYDANCQLVKSRLGNRKHMLCSNDGFFCQTDFGKILGGEKIGDYISRMRQTIELINQQITGEEEIDFSSVERIMKSTQELGKETLDVQEETAYIDDTQAGMERTNEYGKDTQQVK